MSAINNKNEYFNGVESYTTVKKRENTNFDFFGGSGNDTMILEGVKKGASKYDENVRNNVDFDYFGGAGVDRLSYSGNTKSVTMRVDASTGDFKLTGGQRTGTSDYALSSLEVWTYDVEEFELTNKGDDVDLTGRPLASRSMPTAAMTPSSDRIIRTPFTARLAMTSCKAGTNQTGSLAAQTTIPSSAVAGTICWMAAKAMT